MNSQPSIAFSIIILAAGLGKRMNNPKLPKVLVELNGIPLIEYVLNTARKLSPEKIFVIVGHYKEKVIDYIGNSSNIEFIEQREQLGTGHAVAQCKNSLIDYRGNILILSGDVPLLSYITLNNFINEHFDLESDVSVLSADAPNPFGYGRIVRNNKGKFLAIVEEKDATSDIKNITEFNSGVYFINSRLLFSALDKITNNNAQNEYYLTDIIGILNKKGYNVNALKLASYHELLGVNSQEQLLNLEKLIKNKNYEFI